MNQKQKIIRLTEDELHEIITDSISDVLTNLWMNRKKENVKDIDISYCYLNIYVNSWNITYCLDKYLQFKSSPTDRNYIKQLYSYVTKMDDSANDLVNNDKTEVNLKIRTKVNDIIDILDNWPSNQTNNLEEYMQKIYNIAKGLASVSEMMMHNIDTQGKAKPLNLTVAESKDRTEYWKQRWAKQKEEGSIPDRTEYWKERAKKQKASRTNILKQKVKNKSHSFNHLEKDDYDDFDDAMDMMTDNDWGEYFGDHE